jgi:hypothetical protein
MGYVGMGAVYTYPAKPWVLAPWAGSRTGALFPSGRLGAGPWARARIEGVTPQSHLVRIRLAGARIDTSPSAAPPGHIHRLLPHPV